VETNVLESDQNKEKEKEAQIETNENSWKIDHVISSDYEENVNVREIAMENNNDASSHALEFVDVIQIEVGEGSFSYE